MGHAKYPTFVNIPHQEFIEGESQEFSVYPLPASSCDETFLEQ